MSLVNGVIAPSETDRQDGGVTEQFDAPTSLAEYADDTLALKFTARHSADLRYTTAGTVGVCGPGSVWRRADTLLRSSVIVRMQ